MDTLYWKFPQKGSPILNNYLKDWLNVDINNVACLLCCSDYGLTYITGKPTQFETNNDKGHTNLIDCSLDFPGPMQ